MEGKEGRKKEGKRKERREGQNDLRIKEKKEKGGMKDGMMEG